MRRLLRILGIVSALLIGGHAFAGGLGELSAGDASSGLKEALIRGADVAVRGPAPSPGAHTERVLEECGLTAEEIAALAADGVFG